VITYFDEGSGRPVSEQGVAVFDLDGNLCTGYRSTTGVAMIDCYAAVAVGSRSVGFWVDPDWGLTIWNTEDGTQRTHVVPGTVQGANAISHAGERWWFFSPYSHPHTLYEWHLGLPKVTEAGVQRGPLHGLPGGRSLDIGPERAGDHHDDVAQSGRPADHRTHAPIGRRTPAHESLSPAVQGAARAA
jgi:hypothetical protein